MIIVEVKNAAQKRQQSYQSDFARQGVINFVYLLCGILVSRGAVLGNLAPFGASFAAAVPQR